MEFQFEKNKLYAYLGEELVEHLKAYECYIAGGTITSLFCNREINDIDVYFKNEKDIVGFIADIWNSNKWVVSQTKKATLLLFDDIKLQLIHFDYFQNPEDIFTTFDFTSCMGCYDFGKEDFVLHNDFLKHNSQRILKFNKDTAYPIVSLLRVQKYQEKGYTISKPEFIRVILTCMNLNINTYEELKDQLGGMYGINYDKLFEDIDDEEFNLDVAIDKIANIALSEDYFKKPKPVEFENVEDLIANITDLTIKYFKHKGKMFKVNLRGNLDEIYKVPSNGDEISADDHFNNIKLYKFVRKVDDKYFSFYDNNFEYKIGEVVEAKGSLSGWNEGKLHFVEWKRLKHASYCDKEDAVLLEVTINANDLYSAGVHILARKCKVIREVPKEEYEKRNQDEDGFTWLG